VLAAIGEEEVLRGAAVAIDRICIAVLEQQLDVLDEFLGFRTGGGVALATDVSDRWGPNSGRGREPGQL
jgi:hypothetical protein